MDRISWKQLFRSGKKNTKPTAMMLDCEGEVVIKSCKIEGDKVSSPSLEREVHYDRDYVISKLGRDTILLIRGLSQERYVQLFNDVWLSKQRSNHDEE
jgi:hypothetical protein